MDHVDDEMMNEDAVDDSQQQTQSTQQASQQSSAAMDAHLWGYLQPCNSAVTRIDFWKISPRVTIGRNTEHNMVVLPGPKVSNFHCTITWDGSEDHMNVVVCDLSSNGTFINSVKIGKNQTCILREGNEIAFGTFVPQSQAGGLEDYRFIYRHAAGRRPTTGLYAHYDVSEVLGKGSFATVMKAVSRATGQWYAVKMIQDHKTVRSPGDQQQGYHSRNQTFAREISIMEKLRHRNICELKEVFFQEDTNDIHMVLELVKGGDLLDFILKNNGLSEAMAQHITYQICDALSYIHSEGVAHRDLKPENVLLTEDDPPVVKVADFGLAKVVDSLTMLRTMCGTPSYLAPEVVRQENDEGYDNVVDSWSVGVIVFSMLTNASPFIEDDTRDVRTRVATRVVDWGILSTQHVSATAQDFIRRLLEEDPRHRMSLTDALHHPWLLSYTPPANHQASSNSNSSSSVATNDYSMLSSIAENDGSFRSSVDQSFQDMQIQSSVMNGSTPAFPGAFPSGSTAPGVRREGSSTAPLQRRSDLLAQAAEDGNLPDPWELVGNPHQQAAAGPSNLNSKGQNKRVYSELTPLPEESSMDAVIEGSSPLTDALSSTNKSGPDSDEDDVPKKASGSKATRGKGKAAASPAKKVTRARAAKGDEEDEEETLVQPRRSTRHPQKVARHA
ncbi:putative serine/threonine-protein kinase fhkC [Hypsizygus marmoreus]|uniref:Serine/threonine-protein kinase fhkC n=1 Tax=Hypsizygus marmoreus TaxID=39966 RepID=A0A369J5V5_HYPMA|nr:putative serine/threonine-protein kinase fhkC [Hypsizygus marmoreus]